MRLEPTPGLVINFDFLWKEEDQKGKKHGVKDRPCVLVLVTQPKENKSRQVVVCPITHTPPQSEETAVEIPYKVARHLELDHDQMWVKTHQINTMIWDHNHIPFGVSQTKYSTWSYGVIPYALRKQILQQVQENSRTRSVGVVKRD